MRIYSLINNIDGVPVEFFGTRAQAKAAKIASKDRNLKIHAVELFTRREPLAAALNFLVFGKGSLPVKPPKEQ